MVMICLLPMVSPAMGGDDGYMTRYSHTTKDEGSPEIPLSTIVAKLKAKGLKLGVYDSPFLVALF